MKNKYAIVTSYIIIISLFGFSPLSFATDAISKNVNTHEFRMLLLACQRPISLEVCIKAENPIKILDPGTNFEGELFSFTPSKQELQDALESVKLMAEGDKVGGKNPGLAISYYQRALKKNPFDPVLMMSLGVCQAMSGNGDIAIVTLQKAYDISPLGYIEKKRIKNNLDQIKDHFKSQ